MEIHKDLQRLQIKIPVITIGTFDGVHLGHKEIIENLKSIAKKEGGESIILTFWPHPRIVLNPRVDLKLINTLEEKSTLLKRTGVDHLAICNFTHEFSHLTAYEFVRDFLVGTLGVKHLVFGHDHLFGKNKEGNFDKLIEYGKEFGFTVQKVEALSLDSLNISSTHIRRLIEAGKVSQASKYLGYNYFLIGNVLDGHKVGRTIGFPTANIGLNDSFKLIPGDGVYAVKVLIEDNIHKGMLNIGFRPTMSWNKEIKRSIEVHIIDFDENIYSKTIEIEFVEKIREEKKFDNIEDLTCQLHHDKRQVLNILSTDS